MQTQAKAGKFRQRHANSGRQAGKARQRQARQAKIWVCCLKEMALHAIMNNISAHISAHMKSFLILTICFSFHIRFKLQSAALTPNGMYLTQS